VNAYLIKKATFTPLYFSDFISEYHYETEFGHSLILKLEIVARYRLTHTAVCDLDVYVCIYTFKNIKVCADIGFGDLAKCLPSATKKRARKRAMKRRKLKI